jgi:hypothetical protein
VEPIPAHRLDRQRISRPRFSSPAEVVAWFGAMQAQDHLAALWALGVRTPKATEATIESALSDGDVIRMHVFRGTWQYVAREDVRWMLAAAPAAADSRREAVDLAGTRLDSESIGGEPGSGRPCPPWTSRASGGRPLASVCLRGA